MKHLILIIASLFLGSIYVGEANGDEPQRLHPEKVIQVPNQSLLDQHHKDLKFKVSNSGKDLNLNNQRLNINTHLDTT